MSKTKLARNSIHYDLSVVVVICIFNRYYIAGILDTRYILIQRYQKTFLSTFFLLLAD